jgi:enoyl-CoA hydratase/carnithine racemase
VVKTTIYLPDELHQELKLAATERGTSGAELIRTAVRHELLGATAGQGERAQRRARPLAALVTLDSSIQEITPPGGHLDRAIELAESIANRSAPLGVRATLSSAQRALTEGHASAATRLNNDMVGLLQTEDGTEGMLSFIERRPANFVGR